MKTVWSYEFPSKTSAFSRLVCNDSTLYMFNLGFGLKNGQQRTKMGRPFIAAFDKRTGECQFMNMLSLKKDMVEDAVLNPEGAFMLFDDGLAYKHELDDSTVTVSPWDVKEHSQLRAIITQPVYAYYNLKSMFDVIATDGVHFPVITEPIHFTGLFVWLAIGCVSILPPVAGRIYGWCLFRVFQRYN